MGNRVGSNPTVVKNILFVLLGVNILDPFLLFANETRACVDTSCIRKAGLIFIALGAWSAAAHNTVVVLVPRAWRMM